MDQASNAFSVVGAADVVIRSSTNLYSLLKRLADAPENYSQLTSTLKSLTSLTTAVREYADEYNESTFVRKDGLNPLEELNMILSDCQFHIKRVTDFVNSCPMNETEIAKTCQKLQEHMRSIMFILSVNSATNDIVLRDQVLSLNDNIVNYTSRLENGTKDTKDGLEDLKQIILSSAEAERKDIQNLIPLFSDMQQTITATGQNLQAVDRMSTVLNEVHRLAKTLTNTTEKDEILVGSKSLEYIIMLLNIVRPYLSHFIHILVIKNTSEISRFHGAWIRKELMHLLASAHEAAARSLRGRNLQDEYICHDLKSMPAPFAISGSSALQHQLSTWETLNVFDLRTQKISRARIKIPAGQLIVKCLTKDGRSKGQEARKDIDNYGSLEFNLFFAPYVADDTDENVPGMEITITRVWNDMDLRFSITRSLREVNVVSWKSQVFCYVRKNDVEGLRKLLTQRKASPFYYSESGRSLLCEAALGLHLECVELLLQQGADPHNCHLGTVYLSDLSYIIWQQLTMSYFRNVKDFDTIKDLHPLTTREITCRFDVDWRQELDKALSFQSQRTAGSYARILVSLFKQREGHLRLSSLEIEPEDAVRVRELLTECGYNLEIYQERAYIPRF